MYGDQGIDCEGQAAPEILDADDSPLRVVRPPRSVYRKFKICRICLRKMANEGLIPGMRKASW